MEFNFDDTLVLPSNLRFYYKYNKLSKNQKDFMTNLSNSIINNNSSIYEFPPTLDKDFLYNTVLFSLSRQTNKKFIILTKNYDKVYEILKIYTSISKICQKYNKDFTFLKVIPFFDRKMLCINEKIMDEASSLDFDSFCTKITASWVPENKKCQYYTSFLSLKRIEYEENLQSSEDFPMSDKTQSSNSNLKSYNLFSNDFDQTINSLTDKKICPYYYFLNLLQNSESPPDIVICTVSDFFDLKKRIQVVQLLKAEISNYKLIFDESCDILNQLTFNYSMNIDEGLLLNASNQLFILKEKYMEKENLMKEYEEDYKTMMDDLDKNLTNKNVLESTENEFLLYNGLCNSPNSNMEQNLNNYNSIAGIIRKPAHFLNLTSRLITFFRSFIFNPIKTENVWNIYTFQQQLLKELWLDFKSLKFIFGRFILFLNELRWENYESLYSLINFILFINYLTSFSEGFILNYQKYSSGEAFFLELYLIEPYIVLQNYLSKYFTSTTILDSNTTPNLSYQNNPIFLSGGIGKLENFEKMLKFSPDKILLKQSFTDDNINLNLYITNISTTYSSNKSFYGEILLKLSKAIPDGIIFYFSSISSMEFYIQKWQEQGVLDYIMNEKLLFIEESDSIRLASLIVNYKKACDMGRGAILFLSTRNKASLYDASFINNQSRCIVFIGFPIETKLTKKFELELENVKKNFDIDEKEFLNYDAFKLFANKISEKIDGISDKKVLVVLDDKLISDKLKDYLPSWLYKFIHVDYDKENVNMEDRLKNIKKFLNE